MASTVRRYCYTLARNRLLIEQLAEPAPSPDWVAVAPSVGPLPVYSVARCRKRSAPKSGIASALLLLPPV